MKFTVTKIDLDIVTNDLTKPVAPCLQERSFIEFKINTNLEACIENFGDYYFDQNSGDFLKTCEYEMNIKGFKKILNYSTNGIYNVKGQSIGKIIFFF